MVQGIKGGGIGLESWVGFLSSFSEGYIMSLVAFMAPTLGPLLFAGSSQGESMMSSYMLVFLGSFIMYPLGAWYYGHIGDSRGRQKACTASSFGLAVVTGGMGILPLGLGLEYVWICFVVFLALQFFFAAGEYYSSIIFALEHGSETQQGLISGMSCGSSVFGVLFASGLSILVAEHPDVVSWKVPFFIGLLTGLLSFIFKFYCKESPHFDMSKGELERTSWNFLKDNYWAILVLTLMTGLFYTIYGYLFLFLPLIYEKTIDVDPSVETFICLIVYGVVVFLSGYLADKLRIKSIMIFGILSFGVFLLFFIPFFHSVPFLTRLLLTVFGAIYIGPIHSWIVRQTQPDKRCRITALSSAFATAFFSHSCVVLCLFFYQKFMSLWVSSLYLFVLMGVALVILWRVNLREDLDLKKGVVENLSSG